MKKFITKYLIYIVLIAMIALLIPGIGNRIEHEAKNKNVVMSLLYNDIANKVSKSELYENIDGYKKEGLNMISIMEDDINSLVARGDLTCIKYNVLRHKYDKQSLEIADKIEETCKDITFDSYVVLASREDMKESLKYNLPRRYSQDEFFCVGTYDDLDIYILYDGRRQLWDYAVGYNEQVIADLKNMGLNITLVHKVKNYKKTEYLEDMERIIKEYDVKYLNIKEGSKQVDTEENQDNYEGISKIINQNNMTLVVTENTNQLSNQKCFGYSYIFDETVKNGGSQKVIRAYETYDDFQADETNWKYRTEQYFNSTIDRNIRFITITQIAIDDLTYKECADNTLKAVTLYKDKIASEGFTVNMEPNKNDYTANKALNYAACATVMILCLMLMYEMISGNKNLKTVIFAIVAGALAFAGTFILPEALISLYPTAFSVVQSCFAMTVILYFLKTEKDAFKLWQLIVFAVCLILFVLFLGALCMGTLLSGINYYINNDIFRGIKLSLIAPVLYTCIVYYFMFIKSNQSKVIYDVKEVLHSNIKVYGVLIGAVVLAVGLYYIIRSGNVSNISSIEQTMRSALIEIFPERPRTKEFLIGYPALVLFVYYMKNSNIHLIKWLLAVATSVLVASVTNSFCHVFTDFTVITKRTINAFILGVIISAIAYILNLILIKAIKKSRERFKQNTEMK